MPIVSGKDFFRGRQVKQVVPMSTPTFTLPNKQEQKSIFQHLKEKADAFGTKIGERVLENIDEGVDKFGEGVRKMQQGTTLKDKARGALRATSGALSTYTTPVSVLVETAAKPVVDKVKEFSEDHPTATEGPRLVIEKMQEFAQKHPEAAEDVADIINIVGSAFGTKGVLKTLKTQTPRVVAKTIAKDVVQGAKIATKPVTKTVETIRGMLPERETLFGRPTQVKDVDDLVKQADEALKTGTGMSPADLRNATEQVTAKSDVLERWAGISPDIKNRIAGKQEKLKEYFDVAHARNNFDTLPTPLEYGARNADLAVTKMEGLLNDTGSQIGQFRRKIGTYEANIDKVNLVEKSFADQVSKLNLEIRNGQIRQTPGTVRRVNSDSEIRVLNDLYRDLLTVKQNPNLEKLIDLRTLFDHKINFAKSAREVSGSLDPLSRTVRKQIADTAAEIVGKSEAAKLQQYSDFMDAYNDLRSYTDRKAGAEFLLKQVLSERGGTPRAVIQTIKDFTGIDLMDDATMASLATDLIGNSRQKGLFRQEITKAGLDAEAALRGDPGGAINLAFEFLTKRFVDREKQFLRAAKTPLFDINAPATPD